MSSADLFLLLGGIFIIVVFIGMAVNKQEQINASQPKAVRAQILDKNDKHTKGHAITRGVVGNAVAGPVGAVVGAISAKGNDYTEVIFRIWWSDGKQTIETCRTSDPKYKEYLSLIPED